MARVFTKLGKQITIAVKESGSDPDGNARLRVLVQQAKKENMPKENVERAIKRATAKDAADYKEITDEQKASIEKLPEKFEEDEDVQNVFHNMK